MRADAFVPSLRYHSAGLGLSVDLECMPSDVLAWTLVAARLAPVDLGEFAFG